MIVGADNNKALIYHNSDKSSNTYLRSKEHNFPSNPEENKPKLVFEPTKLKETKKRKNVVFYLKIKRLINSKLAIFPAILILAIALIYLINHSTFQSTSTVNESEKSKTLTVKTTTIESTSSYANSQTYVGEVIASRTSEMGFERGGKLVEVLVEEGDYVTKDTPLAKLGIANLVAKRQAIAARKNQATAVLAELNNGARTERVEAAQATVRDLQQQLELEKLKADRREYLYKEGAISREQLDEITFNRQALNERLAGAKSSLKELQNGTRDEQISAQKAVIERLDAEIQDLEITINKSILRSPFNSIVSQRNVDEGTVVESGTSILRLVENTQPKVKIGVPISVASQVELGSKQQVMIGGKSYRAVVNSVLPEVDTATRTREIVLKLTPTAATQVVPKQIARLTITQTKSTDGYWLPINSLVKGDRGLWSCYALVESPEKNGEVVERRYVELLKTQGQRVLVRGTIQSGDEIITNGTHRLVPGQLVTRK